MKLIIATLFLASCANAQVLNIADTLGKGKVGVFAGTSALLVRDFTTINWSFAEAIYGVNDRFDVYAGMSTTTLLGQTQVAPVVGANINILKSKVVNVSLFNILAIPMHRRQESSKVAWFTSVVASRTIQTGDYSWYAYTGYSAYVPIGNRANTLFTPPGPVHNAPLGVAMPIGKWMIFAEYNLGGVQKIAAIGLSRTLN